MKIGTAALRKRRIRSVGRKPPAVAFDVLLSVEDAKKPPAGTRRLGVGGGTPTNCHWRIRNPRSLERGPHGESEGRQSAL